jgi:hypothetical protein
VIVELENHYRASLDAEPSAGGLGAETTIPLMTALGARNSLETFGRALAFRLRPPGCTVTISPGLDPGLTAPLGWELSDGAREDLRPVHFWHSDDDKNGPLSSIERLVAEIPGSKPSRLARRGPHRAGQAPGGHRARPDRRRRSRAMPSQS